MLHKAGESIVNDQIMAYEGGIADWVAAQAGTANTSTEKGQAFCQWCLENLFELPSDQALDAMEMSWRSRVVNDFLLTSVLYNLIHSLR
jgi:hypothetical protein